MADSRTSSTPSAAGVAGIGGSVPASAGVTRTLNASAITRRMRIGT